MGELCLRGYNVAMPEIDKGDDVFVVRDDSGAMWRLQVKTSLGRKQKTSRAFGFRVKESAIITPQTPELHFVFVMRKNKSWRFLIIDRPILRNYVRRNHIGTLNKEYRQINIVFHDDETVVCLGLDLATHLADWATWPKI
jgi:hypothetical protein